MLNLAADHPHPVVQAGERPDVGVFDHAVLSDDDRAANLAVPHHTAFTYYYATQNPRRFIHLPLDAPLDALQDQPVRFQQVFPLAGVFPPSADDVRAHIVALLDEILNGVGDLILVSPGGLDSVHRLEDMG